MSSRSIPLEYVDDDGRPADAAKRLSRLRRLAWLLDRSIPAGKDRRFGLDPIIGLIPGVGDWIASLLSLYVWYEGARLGLPYPVLGRMALNIEIEALVGAIPVAGDVFDFVWQANARNLKLVEQHYRPGLRPRPIGRLIAIVAAMAIVVTVLTLTLAILLARWLWNLITGS
jgi:hypothetical protein